MKQLPKSAVTYSRIVGAAFDLKKLSMFQYEIALKPSEEIKLHFVKP